MQPSHCILVILENNKVLSSAQKNVIAVACDLAQNHTDKSVQKKIMLAVFGSVEQAIIDALKHYPLDIIWILDNVLLDNYCADSYCLACEQLISHCSPAWVLLSHSYRTRDFAPKLAARLKQSLISDCVSYSSFNDQLIFQRPLFQGRLQVDIVADSLADNKGPVLITLQAGCFDLDINTLTEKATTHLKPEVKKINVSISPEQIRTHASPCFSDNNNIDLSKSNIIVAIGRGIQSADGLPMCEKLAILLGAELAASRPVCDEGWLPHERQIGSSGQSVSPSLYIAIGISGAIQHIVGMRSAKKIVAINQDKNAPIFQIADIAIVGDLFDIIPAMIKQLEAIK